MKKRTTKISIAIVVAIILAFAISFASYYFTTMSYDDCVEYCQSNSARYATKFSVFKDGRYNEDYIYLIAADGESTSEQEIFVFKMKHSWPWRLDRYKFVLSSVENNNDLVSQTGAKQFGALQFFTRNDDGEKATDSTLIFFGASADSDIRSYKYTLTVREGSNVYSGNIGRYEDDSWLIKFYGCSDTDDDYKKVISDVKFYDSKGKLVGTWNPTAES